MRRTLLLCLTAAALAASGAPLRADGDADPKREARLLYVEGKFREAEDLMTKAGPEVSNDLDLRAQLADAAAKYVKNKTGEERRAALEAVKRNWGLVATAHPENGAAVTGAVLAAKELTELDLAAKRTENAKAQADWALKLGEKAAAAGLTPETKAALGEAYGLRAATTKKVEQADQISGDFRKGAEMLEQAAAGHEKAAEWLAAAASLRMKEAFFIHDSIPLDKEVRDDQAIVAAAGLARKACEAKGADGETFVLHIRTLCAAKEWKSPGDVGLPFMTPLAPPYDHAPLMVPKNAGWKRQEPTKEWDVILDRNYDPVNDSSVQIMMTAYATKNAIGAKTWRDLEEGVQTLCDRRKGGYSDAPSDVAPVLLGDKKKGPQLWHFTVAGTVAGSSRRNKMAEWVWPSATKKETVLDLRIIDWRRTTSIEDPDIVAFVQSAIPAGLWPPGSVAPPEDPKKKPDKKK